jgi:rSAM/selenodomain-associated transferase 1
VFARAPRLGTVKRRLAADIGDRAALRFYTATLTKLLRTLAADRRFRTILALTPDRAHIKLPQGITIVPQGAGDLGTRMHRTLSRHPHGYAAIIGSDIPEATNHDVAAAFRGLGRTPSCFGPAEDGGYWLVGFGPRRVGRPFANVRWSSEHALADTIACQRGRPVTLLRRLRDVDTKADLRGTQ